MSRKFDQVVGSVGGVGNIKKKKRLKNGNRQQLKVRAGGKKAEPSKKWTDRKPEKRNVSGCQQKKEVPPVAVQRGHGGFVGNGNTETTCTTSGGKSATRKFQKKSRKGKRAPFGSLSLKKREGKTIRRRRERAENKERMLRGEREDHRGVIAESKKNPPWHGGENSRRKTIQKQ